MNEKKIEARKDYMRNYLREYHRTPKMVAYMKAYHSSRKEYAKKLRNMPEQKARDIRSRKKWRESTQGKDWKKKYYQKK